MRECAEFIGLNAVVACCAVLPACSQNLLPEQVLYQAELCPDINDYKRSFSTQAPAFYVDLASFHALGCRRSFPAADARRCSRFEKAL